MKNSIFEDIYKKADAKRMDEMASPAAANLRDYMDEYPEVYDLYRKGNRRSRDEKAKYHNYMDDYYSLYPEDDKRNPNKSRSRGFADSMFPVAKQKARYDYVMRSRNGLAQNYDGYIFSEPKIIDGASYFEGSCWKAAMEVKVTDPNGKDLNGLFVDRDGNDRDVCLELYLSDAFIDEDWDLGPSDNVFRNPIGTNQKCLDEWYFLTDSIDHDADDGGATYGVSTKIVGDIPQGLKEAINEWVNDEFGTFRFTMGETRADFPGRNLNLYFNKKLEELANDNPDDWVEYDNFASDIMGYVVNNDNNKLTLEQAKKFYMGAMNYYNDNLGDFEELEDGQEYLDFGESHNWTSPAFENVKNYMENLDNE